MQKEILTFRSEIISSSHINFLFGAGVNGSALPQLTNASFKKTSDLLGQKGVNLKNGIESAIDQLKNAEERNDVKQTFMEEFKAFHEVALSNKDSKSIDNLRSLLSMTYSIVAKSENRKASMKQVNIFTLNYDKIVEVLLDELGYFYNSVSASNSSSKLFLKDVIGYDYVSKRYIPSFMISKLHGDIDRPIIPGKKKYEEILTPDYFEVAFQMKEKLSRENSILIVIGYSGHDDHINDIVKDCIHNGLTVYWYLYGMEDEGNDLPFDKNSIRIVKQREEGQDTTFNCWEDLKRCVDQLEE